MTKSNYRKLFEPGQIGPLEIKNRIYMPAIGTCLGSATGEVTDETIAWYARRAKGGIGLICTEFVHCATEVNPAKDLPRMLRGDDFCYAPGLADLAEAVHEMGARIGLQIAAGAGASAIGSPWIHGVKNSGSIPVSSSAVPSPELLLQPRPLTEAEIKRTVVLLGQAAAMAKLAGYDLVFIHAHSWTLINHFLSPYYNRRTDKYGGSFENRLRFLVEIINAMRTNTGPDFPIVVKYSAHEYLDGGNILEDGVRIAQSLEQAGIDGLEVSCGTGGGKVVGAMSMYTPPGYMVPLAEAVKKVVKIPVLVAGRLSQPDVAERVLRENKADFIGIGRGVIADPDLPNKIAQGQAEPVRQCIYCLDCMGRLWSKKSIRCTVNPVAGRECQYPEPKQAAGRKKVVVVGGGPAGMESARVAALRGFQVTLYEKEARLGGQLLVAAVPPHKEIFKSVIEYYESCFRNYKNLRVVLKTEATKDKLLDIKPDAVIVATGGEPVTGDIPGVESRRVVTAHDVLSGKAATGKRVVVIGGRLAGCETANFLAQQGKQVTVVDMTEKVATDTDSRTRASVLEELARGKVTVRTGLKVDEITTRGVVVIDRQWHKENILADTVVMALEVKPVNKLVKELEGKVKALHVIGDAREPRRIREAISEGYVTSFSLPG